MNFEEFSISQGMIFCPVCYQWVQDCAWHQCASIYPPRREPPPPPNMETKNNSGEKKPRKKRIPKGALEILRDAAKDEVKTEEDPVPERKTEEPKTEKVKKKPKTHFRKSKKPGRA